MYLNDYQILTDLKSVNSPDSPNPDFVWSGYYSHGTPMLPHTMQAADDQRRSKIILPPVTGGMIKL
jgi:hypothetical protein